MKTKTYIDEKVKLDGDWLVVDCGFNDCAPLKGVIEDIGSALILNFNDYNKALDLILGGNIMYLDYSGGYTSFYICHSQKINT